GEVSLCCLDYDGKEILGNLKNQTIKEIWQGPSLRKIRQKHLTGEFQKLGICRECSKTKYVS
ncbi:SPASM domain-containing protein, partial [candidate division NPL-UPA2 bacterium]|nr:SPASM domain-containing protein [candidate division NPL-UPA2 bacterium]